MQNTIVGVVYNPDDFDIGYGRYMDGQPHCDFWSDEMSNGWHAAEAAEFSMCEDY